MSEKTDVSKDLPEGVYSPGTSRPQIAALFKQVENSVGWEPGSINADIGGGKWDKATQYLDDLGVVNVVFDPGNRDHDWNRKALRKIVDGRADTATIANVLNVIPKLAHRAAVIEFAANVLGWGGVAYFSVYEGDGSGKGKETRDGYQLNRKLAAYLPEIAKFFANVRKVGSRIEARVGDRNASAEDMKAEYGI